MEPTAFRGGGQPVRAVGSRTSRVPFDHTEPQSSGGGLGFFFGGLVMRICSFLPSATEILFALGLGDQVVGVTHECDYPRAAREKPVVVRSAIDAATMGSAEIEAAVRASLQTSEGLYAVDAEALRRADPDLIITQDLCDVCALPAAAVAAASDGLPRRPVVIALKPERLADVLADIRRVGAAAG